MRPENVHSNAWLMPTTRGRNQLEAASGTIPRLANTKPNRAAVLASLMSIGNVMVTPTPTAAPLIAPMTGLVDSKIRSASMPPPSRGTPAARSASLLPTVNVSPPADRSAPAQNARPSPVTITARTESSASARSNAVIISCIIRAVNALSFSGRDNVNVATCESTEYEICVKSGATPRP